MNMLVTLYLDHLFQTYNKLRVATSKLDNQLFCHNVTMDALSTVNLLQCTINCIGSFKELLDLGPIDALTVCCVVKINWGLTQHLAYLVAHFFQLLCRGLLILLRLVLL